MRAAEARAEIIPDNEREPTTDDDQQPQQQLQHPEQREQLYVDVLYTIANTVGQPGSQVSVGRPLWSGKAVFDFSGNTALPSDGAQL